MDEPSLGLSPKLTKEIFDIVVRINRERGVTILLVEQNAHMALKIADYGYVLEIGRIVMEDTGARLAEKDDIREFYLGMKAGGARGEAAMEEARSSGDDGAATRRGRRHDAEAVLRIASPATRRAGEPAAEAARHLARHHLGEFGAVAREVGMGLVALGFAPGECASVLSNTNREWLYADLGILGAGGVSNGIYPTDAPEQVEYLCADSRTVVVFVEDDEQLDKVLEVRARLPQLAQHHRLRHRRPAPISRRASHQPRRPARARARA